MEICAAACSWKTLKMKTFTGIRREIQRIETMNLLNVTFKCIHQTLNSVEPGKSDVLC